MQSVPTALDSSSDTDYGERWRAAMAPRTGDVRRELILEAAEYLGISTEEAERRVVSSATDFPEEWGRMVADPTDPAQVVRFYNESKTELFEQIAWHSGDPIHHRSSVCADLVQPLPGREFLDYGSGIGSNALVFGLAGFNVTLADVADPLRNFARWRCERRGITVRTIDLKRETLERRRYDVVTCFDVLEHVPDPLGAIRQIRDSLRTGGIFFVYAPFGHDPDRPMHIVHDDAVLRPIRALGFARKYEWGTAFPSYLQHPMPPTPYQRVSRSPLTNAAYYVRDVWLNGPIVDSVVRAARSITGSERRGGGRTLCQVGMRPER
jgi:2-polyprenyl-3-methyl-5-hydroxy-6-metoxy-1,4-benzoquinol methylase